MNDYKYIIYRLRWMHNDGKGMTTNISCID